MSEHHDCEGYVSDRFSHQCGKSGKYKEGGKWYCWHHKPSRQESDREKRSRQWQAEWDHGNKSDKLQDRIEKLEERMIKACYALRHDGAVPGGLAILDLVKKHEKTIKALERHVQNGIPQVS